MEGERELTQHKGIKNGEGLPNSFEGILNNRQGSVEADAVILADGSIVILHGKDFGRTLEEIESLDIEQLQNLDIPDQAGKKSEQKSPLLREFVGLASDVGTAISLELKAVSSEKAVLLAEKIAIQLIVMKKESGFKGNEDYLEKGMTFESFSVKALKALKERGTADSLNFKTTLYWPTDHSWAKENPLFELEVLESVGIEDLTWAEVGIEVAFNNDLEGIEFQPGEITPQLVEYAHARGVEINSGLVNDSKQINYLFSIGVDHVLTE